MNASMLRDRFLEEQDYLQKYIEHLKFKTAIFEKDIREIENILSKYELLQVEQKSFWSSWEKPYSLDELQNIQSVLDNAKPKINLAMSEIEKELETLSAPDGLRSIDVRSFEGELIQFMLDALEYDTSPKYISKMREEAIEQIKQDNAEMGNDEEVKEDTVDFAIQSAIYLLKTRKFDELQFVTEKADEIEIALRMLKPETEINVLRQGFILLMTIFDATVFDLTRVALQKDFFRLIGIFGKQEKVSLESFGKYDDFEKFKEETIEDQLKAKYLKDILSILESLHVDYITINGFKAIHLKEMVQRRNIHVHNRGRVDDKYLEKDSNGTPRYNIYNLALGSIAHIDVEYWNMANTLCRNCMENLANWVDSL